MLDNVISKAKNNFLFAFLLSVVAVFVFVSFLFLLGYVSIFIHHLVHHDLIPFWVNSNKFERFFVVVIPFVLFVSFGLAFKLRFDS